MPRNVSWSSNRKENRLPGRCLETLLLTSPRRICWGESRRMGQWSYSQISPYHSLKQAMQPSLLVCGTVGHISQEHYRILLTKPLMPVWIFMLEVFGRDIDLHSSTFGCVTLMQTLTETWILSKSTRSMRTRRRKYAVAVCGKSWISNRERSPL